MDNEAVKSMIHKIVAWLAGEPNKRILEWVDADNEAYEKIIKFMDQCATNGWVDIKVSPFEYATDESVEIAQSLYNSAMKYFGGGK